jgi:hypothetical protein
LPLFFFEGGKPGWSWLNRIAASLDRVTALASGLPRRLKRLQHLLRRGLEETAELWPPAREASNRVKRVARPSKNTEELPAKNVRRRLVQLSGRMREAAATAVALSVRAGLRRFRKLGYLTELAQRCHQPSLPA